MRVQHPLVSKICIGVLIAGFAVAAALLVLFFFGPEAQASHSRRAAEPLAVPSVAAAQPAPLAAEQAPEAPAEPLATEPEVSAAPPVPLENLLFLGDSMIANPETVASVFTSRGHQVLAGHGATIPQFFGATAHTVSVGAEGMGMMTGSIRDLEFNGIIVLLGANDIAFLSPEQAMENYRALLDELNAFTDAPVTALAVFPTGAAYQWSYGEAPEQRNARSAELNRLISAYCEETEGLYYADATAPFTDEDGLLEMDAGDGLHVHIEKYDLFYDAVAAALRETGIFG